MEIGAMSDFYQQPPTLQNTYLDNRWLRPYLRYKLPKEVFQDLDGPLSKFGAQCAGDIALLGRQAEREKPVHVPYDPWGKRIDQIRVSQAWVRLQHLSASEGLISIAYKRALGEFSRLHQFSKLYLFHPSSAFFTCPLAMTDGAARCLELYGSEDHHRAAFKRLTSDNPKEFWTSGQWMTEREGGSDVSNTGTRVQMDKGKARLYGTKWFSSATTADMALALARYPDSASDSRGLSLFLVKTYAANGDLNHIQVNRLKDKLGTWALPTAELTLQGTFAEPLGPRDQGVKCVASMLNVTRLYNSVCSVGQLTRGLDLLRDYSARRKTFGKPLSEHVLHYVTFAEEELKNLSGFLLTFELGHLLGKEECKTATADESEILRLMTPVCKLFTAQMAVHGASKVIEGFGGAGYIEDTGLPVLLRDSQVFPIWEGPTNVLCLDMVRAMQKGRGLQSLCADIERRMKAIRSPGLEFYANVTIGALDQLNKGMQMFQRSSPDTQLASSRSLAFFLARFYAYSLLMTWADQESEMNQKLMAPWVEIFGETYLRPWQPKSEEDCGRMKRMWNEQLEV
jgi:putative acyl-CoA dehydrogenase